MTDTMPSIHAPKESTRTALAIGNTNGQLCAIAARAYQAGDEIVHLTGVTISKPTRFSVQVGEQEHVEPPSGAGLEELIGEHTWRYMNHSCEPNTAFRGRTLIALRRIAPGDEVRFHYAATEYEMAEPFACQCGATACVGSLQGYRSLSPAQRSRLAPFAQPHVLSAATREDRNNGT
ncbi:MAG: hypothetical protein ACI89X_001028 [Planctomycetota bacterium]|jgi:hypothetical protein